MEMAERGGMSAQIGPEMGGCQVRSGAHESCLKRVVLAAFKLVHLNLSREAGAQN